MRFTEQTAVSQISIKVLRVKLDSLSGNFKVLVYLLAH